MKTKQAKEDRHFVNAFSAGSVIRRFLPHSFSFSRPNRGGSSTLADDLLENGFADVSVLDISAAAMEKSRERLGKRAAQIEWIEADITDVRLPENHYDAWHDRAVFHFLIAPEDRKKYVELVMRSLKVGGYVIVVSFGKNGPKKCSGLDVMRYSLETMHGKFGDKFKLVKSFMKRTKRRSALCRNSFIVIAENSSKKSFQAKRKQSNFSQSV